MAEAADDLSAPLGRNPVRGKRRLRLPFSAIQALAALLGVFLATFAGYALFNDDPLGGEPRARIAIAPMSAGAENPGDRIPEKPAAAEPMANSPMKAGAPGEQRTVTIID